MFKKYRIGFDVYGLILFVLIMLPNFIWFAIPAPHDILRNKSVTPTIDFIASIFQVVMIATLCLIKHNKAIKPTIRSCWILATIVFCLLYFISWLLYYQNFMVCYAIFGLSLFPCLAFLTYEINRKNWIAFVPTLGFSALHITFCILNFII